MFISSCNLASRAFCCRRDSSVPLRCSSSALFLPPASFPPRRLALWPLPQVFSLPLLRQPVAWLLRHAVVVALLLCVQLLPFFAAHVPPSPAFLAASALLPLSRLSPLLPCEQPQVSS